MVDVPPRFGINYGAWIFFFFQISRNRISQYFPQSVTFHSPDSIFRDFMIS